MKKRSILLSLSFILISCGGKSSHSNSNTINSVSFPSSITQNNSNEISNTGNSIPSSSVPSLESSSTSDSATTNIISIAEINEIGSKLSEGEIGQFVTFNAVYLKKITDNNDKLMLTADNSNSFVYVRVSIGNWNDFMENNYLNYDYIISGNVTKHLGNVEVAFQSLTRLNTQSIEIDLSAMSNNKSSISAVYEEFSKLSLSNKYNGIGKIVTFKGKLIATDRSDSNSKGVFYDGSNVITVIDTKKIGTSGDFGKEYSITGSLSVLKSGPAILLLDSEIIDNSNTVIDYNSDNVVSPSYFKKWNTTSSKMNPPDISDYSVLYKTTGYVKSEDMNGKYYLGIVDNASDSLSDTGISTSISGFFLMNNLNMSDIDLSYSIFEPYFTDEIPVTFCFTLFQFETNWHGWKMMPIDVTVPAI